MNKEHRKNSADRYINQGLAKIRAGDYVGANKDFNKAIELYPKNARAYNGRGIARESMGDHRGAIHDYDQAIKIDPKNANVYGNRGSIKSETGDYLGAIRDFSSVIKIDPKSASAYVNRAIVKFHLDDHRGALLDYNIAIKIDPKQAEAYFHRGIFKDSIHDHRGALLDYKRAIKIDPLITLIYNVNGLIYNSRGMSKMSRGDHRGAIRDYNKSISLAPHDYVAHDLRGIAKRDLHDYKGAIQDFSKAIKLSKDYFPALNDRGYTKYISGDIAGAKRDYRRIIKSGRHIVGSGLEGMLQDLMKYSKSNARKLKKLEGRVLHVDNSLQGYRQQRNNTPAATSSRAIGGTQKKENELQILPKLVIDVKNATAKIGKSEISGLTPMEFAHYCVFADRAKHKLGPLTAHGGAVDLDILKEALNIHRIAFPDLDGYRMVIEQKLHKEMTFGVQTWRGHISRINKAIRALQLDLKTSKAFEITRDGPRGATKYLISAPPGNITIST